MASMGEPSSSANSETITRACDACRKKKIRCEPTGDGCMQCTKYHTRCHFTPIKAKKGPRKPPGYRYIKELEDRLMKMEGLLEKALQGQTVQGNGSPRAHSLPFVAPDLREEDRLVRQSHSIESQSGTSSSSSQGQVASLHNFDPNPSIMSWFQGCSDLPNGFSHANDAFLAPKDPSESWNRELALGPFSMPSFFQLPSKIDALELVEDTFRSFNRFFPLFDEQEFLQQFHERYIETSPSDPAWWACINVVFSLAHRFRAMRGLDTAYENSQACGYIHNALAVVSELSITHRSLPAIQALLGMAIIIEGTPNPGPGSVIVASAVRLAQAMGLHRKCEDPSLTEAQIEQRRRVFWIAYNLDKDISLRMGQSFAQDDDDMDAELPAGNLTHLPQCMDEPRRIDFFNSRIGLAVIQGQIYKRLYSVQASRQSPAQRTAVASELDMILSYWKKGVSLDLRDDLDIKDNEHVFTIEFLHMLILRATYVNCLAMIDRHLPRNQKTLTDSDSQGTFFPQERICVIESRKAIRLIKSTPHGDYACVWLLLHPFYAAVTTLLDNIIDYPASPQASFDLEIVEPFLRLLETLAANDKQCARSEEAKRMKIVCHALNGRAEEAVEAARTSLML